MNREELEAYILNHYSTEPDYPWADTPRAAVFRHAGNRKWFALVMEVPRDKLGLAGAEKLDIVNFKCDPILIASLRGEPGIFPAYHMNKSSWITAALDGSVSTETIDVILGKLKGQRRPFVSVVGENLQPGFVQRRECRFRCAEIRRHGKTDCHCENASNVIHTKLLFLFIYCRTRSHAYTLYRRSGRRCAI